VYRLRGVQAGRGRRWVVAPGSGFICGLFTALLPVGAQLLLNIIANKLADFLRWRDVLLGTELLKLRLFQGVNQ